MLSPKELVAKINKKYALICLVVIAAIAIGAILVSAKNDGSTKNNKQAARPHNGGKNQVTKHTYYTYGNSDVTCKQLPVSPGSASTINVCSGTVNVTNKDTKQAQTFKVSSATHLYDHGKEIPLDQLSNLSAGQTQMNLTFTASDKNTLSNIIYY
jgi:hypothetical protein